MWVQIELVARTKTTIRLLLQVFPPVRHHRLELFRFESTEGRVRVLQLGQCALQYNVKLAFFDPSKLQIGLQFYFLGAVLRVSALDEALVEAKEAKFG